MTAMNVERGASDDRSDRGMIAERLTSEPFYSWEGRRPAARTAAAPRESESKFPPEAGGSCGLLGVCVCLWWWWVSGEGDGGTRAREREKELQRHCGERQAYEREWSEKDRDKERAATEKEKLRESGRERERATGRECHREGGQDTVSASDLCRFSFPRPSWIRLLVCSSFSCLRVSVSASSARLFS